MTGKHADSITTAPRCLREFRTQSVSGPDILLDTLTEWPNRFYALGCRHCRSGVYNVIGTLTSNVLIHQHVLGGALRCRCVHCRKTVPLFDPSRHGYDVELDHFPPRTATAGQQRFRCPGCDGEEFSLTARFEYPARLIAALEAGESTGYAKHHGREQDLFTWFTLIGRCAGCAALTTIASECCA